MDVNKIFEMFCDEWDGLAFDLTESSNDKLDFEASMYAEKYFDDGILLEGTIYSSGTIHLTFTFDELNRTLENYELINSLNWGTSFAKAYITKRNGKDFLQIHYALPNISEGTIEQEVVDAISFCMNDMLDPDVLKYLQPLTDITK